MKQAEALLNTTSVKVFLHQNHDQVADLLVRCGLTPAEAERLPTMPAHQALWKIGTDYTALTNQVLHGRRALDVRHQRLHPRRLVSHPQRLTAVQQMH